MSSKRMGMLLRLLGIGWYVGLCIAAGAIAGLLGDRALDLTPLLTLLGIALGLIAAVGGLVRMILALLSYISENKN